MRKDLTHEQHYDRAMELLYLSDGVRGDICALKAQVHATLANYKLAMDSAPITPNQKMEIEIDRLVHENTTIAGCAGCSHGILRHIGNGEGYPCLTPDCDCQDFRHSSRVE